MSVMSFTLVETYSADPQPLNGSKHSPAVSRPPFGSRALSIEDSEPLEVSQLVRLASQHRRSDYNRIKYGPRGGPVTYIPLSLQTPDQFKRLQERQARCSERQLWWPCNKLATTTDNDSIPSSDAASEHVYGPRLCHLSSSGSLQEELSAAMSSPILMDTKPATPAQSLVRTSETHPLNVSAIIPDELLEIISSHLTETPHQNPVMFELPSYLSLDKVTVHSLQTSSELPSRPVLPPIPVPSVTAPLYSSILDFPKSSKLANLLSPTSSMRRVLHFAVGRTLPSSFSTCSGPISLVGCDTLHHALPTPTKMGAAEGVLPIRTLITFTECGKQGQPESPRLPSTSVVQTKSSRILVGSESYGPVLTGSDSLSTFGGIKTPALLDLHSLNHIPQIASHPQRPQTPLRTTRNLGNLFLSSCPGKKVRLQGPVKGRSSVCRDLRQDLCRLKTLEVACIICCLDDDELEFLGVSWTDYSRIADEIGIDVLRIPISEGMAPTDPALIDSRLTLLIQNYTLRGALLLVHCRGGVGRAGLLACCWMLKLGLCGWIDGAPPMDFAFTAPENSPPAAPGDGMQARSGVVRRDTLQLVERVLAVVRQRRSPKAIETFEQVKFLVDFVEHLRTTTAERIANWDIQVD